MVLFLYTLFLFPMNSLLQTLTSSLGEKFISQASTSLGGDTTKTKGLVNMALPLLLGALKKNTQADGGAGVLAAIEKKHDGGILENFSDLVAHPESGQGSGILKHLFGGNQANAEKLLASQAGVSEKESGGILKMLAPMVMGALGKNSAQAGGFDLGSLTSLISDGATESDKKSSLSSSLLTSFLDKDGDGSIIDDVAEMAMKKFF